MNFFILIEILAIKKFYLKALGKQGNLCCELISLGIAALLIFNRFCSHCYHSTLQVLSPPPLHLFLVVKGTIITL